MEALYVPAGYMTAHQVADTLGIKLTGVRDLVHRGHLHRVGGSPRQPRYDSDRVFALLAARLAA
jgi:hypothetical protein